MHLCGELEIYFLAGFFLFVRLSTASGPVSYKHLALQTIYSV